MTINVTQEDIEKGLPKLVCACPISRALLRQVPEINIAMTGYDKIQLFTTIEKEVVNLQTPPSAALFANNFDLGIPVEPFSFELEVP